MKNVACGFQSKHQKRFLSIKSEWKSCNKWNSYVGDFLYISKNIKLKVDKYWAIHLILLWNLYKCGWEQYVP